MIIKYNGENLDFRKYIDGKLVLWIQSPAQRSMEKMTFVGGYPNEYCIFMKDLDWTERNDIYKQVMGYNWFDITDKQVDYYIGAGWQTGIGHGKINGKVIYYLYYGSPNRNDTFYIIVKISTDDYSQIKDKYKDYLLIPGTIDFKTLSQEQLTSIYKTYIHDNCNTIMEGWEILFK